MKKFIITLSFFFGFFYSQANYDNMATLDSLCFVNIDSVQNGFCFEANPSGDAPFTYLWNDGTTGNATCMTAGVTEYCVTVTDATGCVAVGCAGGTTTPTCNVWIYNENIGGSYPQLTAVTSGTAPFTYSWTSGEATETIQPTSDGAYCVTIVDATGCSSVACDSVIAISNCDVTINGNSTTLTATATGDAPFIYNWDTGEATQSISPTSTGYYCVTITSSTGCQAYGCMAYTTSDEISGAILLDSLGLVGNGANSFMVYLIQNDAVAGTLTAVDSQVVNATPNGAYYSFTGLADGDYLVKAAIEVGSDQYDNYLPTYYGNVLYWSDATTVSVPGTNNYTYIAMTVGVNPGGPGFIGGLISEGANFTSGTVETRGEGDPVANVNVLLLTATDEAITHTVTDANGEFTFPSLAYGTYKLVVEVLGKTPGIKMITISADNPTINVSFDVNETNVTKIEDVLNGASLKVFPNPVTESMNVQIEIRKNVNLNVTVTNLLGETMISDTKQLNEGTQTLNVNMKNFPTGIYFLNLSDGQDIISKKILKQ